MYIRQLCSTTEQLAFWTSLSHLQVLAYSMPISEEGTEWTEMLSKCNSLLSNVHSPYNHIDAKEYCRDIEVVQVIIQKFTNSSCWSQTETVIGSQYVIRVPQTKSLESTNFIIVIVQQASLGLIRAPNTLNLCNLCTF